MLWSDVFTIARSARATSGEFAVATLLLLFGSLTSLLMEALLMRIVPSGVAEFTLTTTLMVAEPPLLSGPSVQMTGCAGLPGMPPEQVPALGVTLTRAI